MTTQLAPLTVLELLRDCRNALLDAYASAAALHREAQASRELMMRLTHQITVLECRSGDTPTD